MSSSIDSTLDYKRSDIKSHADSNPLNSNPALNEQFFGRRYYSRHHRCHRCNRFFGRCRCNRRMFHSFRNACMCGMMLKLMLVMVIVFALFKFMGSNNNYFNRPLLN
jgi:hypothetical protein